MKLKAVFFLILLLSVTFTLSAKTANAEFFEVTIGSDGSINPNTAPITLDGAKYLVTADFTGSITIERSNILLDGGGHTLQGIADVNQADDDRTYGVYLAHTESVWVQNLTVKGFHYGIFLQTASECVITECYTNKNGLDGIKLDHSSGNYVLKNTVTNNADDGVQLYRSSNNSVSGNLIRNNNFGTQLTTSEGAQPAGIQVNSFRNEPDSENNVIVGNVIEGNARGILLGYLSYSTTVTYNTLKENRQSGIEVDMMSTGNVVHHNNFIQNSNQVIAREAEETLWYDDKQGNYWSDYQGVDSDQNGIGDSAYASIYRYPLINQVIIEDAQISPPEYNLIAPSPKPLFDFDSLSPVDAALALVGALFVGVIIAIIVVRINGREKPKLEGIDTYIKS